MVDELLTAIAALAALLLIAWTRYLQHKETLRMLERGAESRDVVEFTRSTQLRRGLLSGIVLLALGAGLGAGLALANEGAVVEPAAAAALTGLAVFLFALGTGIVFLHILWMRQTRVPAATEAPRPAEPPEPEQ
jgi:hypothetical protein